MPHLKKGSVLLEKATKAKVRVVGYTDKTQAQVTVELLGDENKKKDGSFKTKVFKSAVLKNAERYKVVKEGEGAKPNKAKGEKSAKKAEKPAKAAKAEKPAKAEKAAKAEKSAKSEKPAKAKIKKVKKAAKVGAPAKAAVGGGGEDGGEEE